MACPLFVCPGMVDELRAEIHHVDVGAQADVIGEIPAGMVGIFIDDNVVTAQFQPSQ